MAKEIFSKIQQQISHDIVGKFLENENSLAIDEVIILVAVPLCRLDFNSLTKAQKELKHIIRMVRFFGKSKSERFYHYTKDAAIQALKNEFLPLFEDEIDMKCAFLSDIKLIEVITDDGTVYLKPNLVDTYSKVKFEPIKYGTINMSGTGGKKTGYSKSVPKEILTQFSITTEMEEALQPFIQLYKKHWDWDVERERYKWDAVKVFQQKFDINSSILSKNLQEALNPSQNLLAGPYYYPRSMMVQFAEHSPEETRAALLKLFDEEKPLVDRVDKFLSDCQVILNENIAKGNFKSTDHTQQSERSAAVYLSFMHPSKHYLYKAGMYYDFRTITGLDLPSLSRFESKLSGYERICDGLRNLLLKDAELIKLHNDTYKDDISDYHLLTQDFIYFVSYHIDFLKRNNQIN